MKEIAKKSFTYFFNVFSLVMIFHCFCDSFSFYENIISYEPVKRIVCSNFDFNSLKYIIPMMIGYIVACNSWFYNTCKRKIIICMLYTILFFIFALLFSIDSFYTEIYLVISCLSLLFFILRTIYFVPKDFKTNNLKLFFESLVILTLPGNIIFNIRYFNSVFNAPLYFYIIRMVYIILLLSLLVLMYVEFSFNKKIFKPLLLVILVIVILFCLKDYFSNIQEFINLYIIKKEIADLSNVGSETIKNSLSFIGFVGLAFSVLYEMIRKRKNT